MANTTQPAATCGSSSRRIINKIPLDFNKLRCAGLDRILAEELSKQNSRGKKGISIASTTRPEQEHMPDSCTNPSQETKEVQKLTTIHGNTYIEQCCRICLDNSSQLVNIMSSYPEENSDLSLHDLFNDVMDDACQVESEDQLPHHICKSCAIATKNAYDLRRKCEESYRYFCRQLDLNTEITRSHRTESECAMNIKEEPADPNSIIEDVISDIESYDMEMVTLKKEDSDYTNESNNEDFLPDTTQPEVFPPNHKPTGFNIRLLLIRKREQLDSQEDLYEEDKGKGPLQCGLCFSRCGLTNWHAHLGEHYGIGWLHGQKSPSLTRGGLIAQMTNYLKEDRSNRLSCRICNRQFSSGLGMMQHLEGCGEELQRFQCPHCNRLYTKLSLMSHQRGCSKKDSIVSTKDNKNSSNRICKRQRKLTPKVTWLMNDVSKRRTVDRSPFNLRLLLIRKREQLNNTEDLRDVDEGSGPLQCGLCLAHCAKSSWKMHIADHYGVGWIKKDEPHTLTRSGVITMMQSYLKDNQGSRLICRLCGREFASGLGMILHLEGCGEKQKRLNCQFCNRSYTRLSLQTHLRSCSSRFEHQFPPSKPIVEPTEEANSRKESNEEANSRKESKEEASSRKGSKGEASSCKGPKGEASSRKGSKREASSRKESKVPKVPFNLRLLLIRHRDDLESQKDISHQGKGDGPLQCGLCLEHITKVSWKKHLSTHYGVGWFYGQEPRMITRHTIIGLMNNYLKNNPGRRLACRLCIREFGSGLGMLLHLEGCGVKQQRLKCKYCGRAFSRLSMVQHIRICEKQFEKEIDEMEAQTDVNDSGFEGVGNDELSTSKRKRFIQMNKCSKSCSSHKVYTRCQQLDELVAEKWKQFIEKNYAKAPLYTDYLPSYVEISLDKANDLLNSRQLNSIHFAYAGEVKCEWIQLKPMDAMNAKNDFVTYLGGPIRQLAWVPLPPTVTEQYLLCSLRSKMHQYTPITNPIEDDTLMVLLKCTVESSELESSEVWPLQAKLHYGIRIPNGPVLSFAFMPSGGYIESANRLGLLAVATSSSKVQIYALPLVLADDKVLVIELIPLIALNLDVKSVVQDYCTKICWSEASGHSFLVSGYASGNVAFWDIADVDGINCFKHNNHCNFVPMHYFYIGERNIQFLELHYDTNGTRWLAVGTSLRKLKIYDLLNISQPVPLVGDAEVTSLFKGCISWPAIWETIAIGESSVFRYNFTRLMVLNPSGVLFTSRTIDHILETARDMHFNCQENILIVITENGDLAFINPRELNMEPRIYRSTHVCRAVSYTELVNLKGESIDNESISVDDFHRDYGVIMKPLIAVTVEKKKEYLNHERRPGSYELETMGRLNSVRWNANSLANTWVAVGAEHGILRIVNFARHEYFN